MPYDLVSVFSNLLLTKFPETGFSRGFKTRRDEGQSDTQVPEDLEAEELAFYAQQCDALGGFEDLDALADQIFSLSDVEEELGSDGIPHPEPRNDNMDIS
jgi:hypothetical protein